jgi:hypothetical protein
MPTGQRQNRPVEAVIENPAGRREPLPGFLAGSEGVQIRHIIPCRSAIGIQTSTRRQAAMKTEESIIPQKKRQELVDVLVDLTPEELQQVAT